MLDHARPRLLLVPLLLLIAFFIFPASGIAEQAGAGLVVDQTGLP